MPSLAGPPAVYPAKRVLEWYHPINGLETFLIHEHRADDLILSIKRSYPCYLVAAATAKHIWTSLEEEFVLFWEDIHNV